ncbi:MAG: bifunctional folylpolyglutamate synthase/dihydrofolate synthase [Fusobacteria bacterium]|nr:bifunctional folylpolyglutamate synthase/dihydrofolate synthase [Fusobacteriota bacterium]
MDKLLEKLYSYNSKGIKLGLDNIRKIMDKLGNPQNNYKIIHIAGTNGKGSTASILENVLIENSYKVGKYTSPHLVKFNERIVVNRELVEDSEIIYYFNKIEKIVNDLEIEATFFEITTAIMLQYFSDKKVDWAILETGMGGRFDSTNIVNPTLSVITNVSIDHTEFLGDTIEKIAHEKAGIIKENIPLFFCDDKENVKEIFKSYTNLYIDILEKYNNHSYYLDMENYNTVINIDKETYVLPLFGDFQCNNFLTAYGVLRSLGISKESIKQGIKNTVWSGRLEIVKKDKINIFDGAHNFDSATKLCNTIKKMYNKDEVILVCSILKDKDVKKILEIFSDFSSSVVFTSLDYYRGMCANELKNIGREFFSEIYVENSIQKAINTANLTDKKAVVYAGSLYFIGELKKVMVNEIK